MAENGRYVFDIDSDSNQRDLQLAFPNSSADGIEEPTVNEIDSN